MDILTEPMLNINDVARYLDVPPSTLNDWRRSDLIHWMPASKKSWPDIPFVGVIEAFVLRSLRKLNYSRRQIVEAAEGIRREFGDEYGLARPGVGHDQGVEIFYKVGADIFRVKDGQQAVRDMVGSFQECITWVGNDPQRLKLAQLGNVYLDPRFGWGKPVATSSNIPVPSIMGLWYAGEGIDTISAEYDIPAGEIQNIIQSWSRVHDQAA